MTRSNATDICLFLFSLRLNCFQPAMSAVSRSALLIIINKIMHCVQWFSFNVSNVNEDASCASLTACSAMEASVKTRVSVVEEAVAATVVTR